MVAQILVCSADKNHRQIGRFRLKPVISASRPGSGMVLVRRGFGRKPARRSAADKHRKSNNHRKTTQNRGLKKPGCLVQQNATMRLAA
jgi:hypothetical protein